MGYLGFTVLTFHRSTCFYIIYGSYLEFTVVTPNSYGSYITLLFLRLTIYQ
jgi:hypothetical protein